MNSSRAVGIYCCLLRIYPRPFRDEYRDDMALAFAQQLRDETGTRVWTRSLIALAITVPHLHLQARMNRPPNQTVPVVFAGAQRHRCRGSGPRWVEPRNGRVRSSRRRCGRRPCRRFVAHDASGDGSAPRKHSLVAGPSRRCRRIDHDDLGPHHRRRGTRRVVGPGDDHMSCRHHDNGHRAHPGFRTPHDPPPAQRHWLTVHARSPASGQPRNQLGETVHSMTRTARLSAAPVTLAFAGCGDIGTNRPNSADGASNAENAFCSAMEGAPARLARATDTTSPQALRVEFGEVVTLLDKVEEHAPAAISDDVTAFGGDRSLRRRPRRRRLQPRRHLQHPRRHTAR